ncbi:serpin family protein [Streptomyces sp. CB01881]|uniref:serpin family protein n=1 Tax=Streptomyces sp. CB01881 TaxID=2078691 RepID=UPI000CDC4DA5|nr:serpin family protein [Streptomyces sp. CB01881]AUY51304.1 serpin family protein [Streptomyces sp. CB01881]TYC74690.1 serpin family protein [Streptomyces sp. CB01881]
MNSRTDRTGPRPAVLLLTATLTAALAAPLLTGCGSTGAAAPVVVRASAPASPPPADPAQVAATAAATNAFGLDLLHTLTADPGQAGRNVVLSPSGLATVLAMVLPGARGTTADELAKALHTELAPQQYALATGALDRPLPPTDGLALRQSDDLWAQQGFPLNQDYLATLAAAFDTGVHTADFRKDPEGARKAVNAAVEKATEGRIKNLFGEKAVNEDTRLALTDALYLKAKWASPFKAGYTADKPFHRLDGSAPAVSTMRQSGTFRYAEGSGGILGEPWQAVELPYADGGLAMDLLVPAQGGFAGFVKGLDQAQLTRILGELAERSVDLTLPRFHFDTANELTPTLRALGVNAAFDAADLGGIPGPGANERLKIGTVVQKATIEVDEEGTVAAAGSGVGLEAAGAAAPKQPAELHIDRPFLFLIRDTATGRPLFLGQVTDPQAR